MNNSIELFPDGDMSCFSGQEYKDYLKASSKVEFKRFTLRFIMFLYTYFVPGATQNDFAMKLGISPMSLSRALNQNVFVKEEWEDAIRELFSTITLDTFEWQAKLFINEQTKLCYARDRFWLSRIAMEHIKQRHNLVNKYQLKEIDGKRSFCLREEDSGIGWFFFDYDEANQGKNNADYPLVFNELETFCTGNNIGRITLFTNSPSILEQLVGKFMIQYGIEKTNKPNLYCSVMLLCDYDVDITEEYVLIDNA